MEQQVQRESKASGLTENQIRWCRANLKPFNAAWKSVKASDENAERVRRQLEKST